MKTKNPTHRAVQEHYGKYAREAGSCCANSACCQEHQNTLYPSEVIEGIPDDVASFSAGSGDPVSPAKLKPGETALDLGSGGGLDCFIAARQVGGLGRVIGVDMTPEMLERSRVKATELNLNNVEFREGLLEALPVEANSIDVIISNCVINLSPDKPEVFKEMFRSLKPGGRIAVSDPVSNQPLPSYTAPKREDWCGCTAGALSRQVYASELEKAGFEDIHIEVDTETIGRMMDSGQTQAPESILREQLLDDLKHINNLDRLLVVPHLITAIKPNPM
ncbi:MAG: arsenite methyltransferase [Anaerolineaceae bacterium]|nr:arsenite methyltransferase [Anaerolineaceae bacterium]